MRRRVLVTGHCGFVGRHVTATLDARGDRWTGVDLVGDGRSRGDARDFFRRDTQRWDLVVHLAAVVGGRRTIERDPLAVAVDLAIDAELWQWALRTRPGRVVYFSSSAAYPTGLQTADFAGRRLAENLIDLDHLRTPDMSYGLAKLVGEYQARLVEAEGVPVTVVRPFSGYGSSQDPSYPMPAIAERIRRHDDPVTVWGNGQQVRDWIHIDDVVGATLAAVEQEITGPFNACTGVATSFDELVRTMADAEGYHPAIYHELAEPSGVAYRVGDPTRMLSFYQPKVSLEEGIRQMLSVGRKTH